MDLFSIWYKIWSSAFLPFSFFLPLFSIIFNGFFSVFKCGYRISIRGFVRPSVRNAFVKIAKSIGKWLFFAYPPIQWSVRPYFVCLSIILSVHHSVYPSVHLYDCSHIVKIGKSIAKSSKWNLSSMKWKNIEKKIALKSRIVVRKNLFQCNSLIG